MVVSVTPIRAGAVRWGGADMSRSDRDRAGAFWVYFSTVSVTVANDRPEAF
jgi:hypothetical protein